MEVFVQRLKLLNFGVNPNHDSLCINLIIRKQNYDMFLQMINFGCKIDMSENMHNLLSNIKDNMYSNTSDEQIIENFEKFYYCGFSNSLEDLEMIKSEINPKYYSNRYINILKMLIENYESKKYQF